MKRLALGLLAFSFALPLASQTAPLPRYKVLPRSTDKAAAAQWNAAADQGYRFIFETRFAVMRLDAAAPDTYRYQRLPDRSLRATFLNALNEQGAFGYAWLPQTGMLEKLPHPRTYEYAVVEGIADKKRKASLGSLQAQGFRPVGLFGGVTFFMRESMSNPPNAPSVDLMLLDRTNHKKLLRQIVAAGQQGYRYRGDETVDNSTKLAMERCGAACGGPFEYRECKFKTAEDLESQLNALGSDGFHVVAESLSSSIALVERSAVHASTYAYRVRRTKDPTELEGFLNTGDRDGFVPTGFAAHVGWTVDLMIVLEKAIVAAPRP